MAIGFLGALVSGAIEPGFALLFAETFEVGFLTIGLLDTNRTHRNKILFFTLSPIGYHGCPLRFALSISNRYYLTSEELKPVIIVFNFPCLRSFPKS